MQKLITYNRANKDFDMFLDGEYQGSRERHIEAEVELDRLAYEALIHSAGAIEIDVEGALERLAEDNEQHAITAAAHGEKADATYFRRATTAFTNALVQYRAGVRPEQLKSGAFLLPSSRAGEPPHIVRMDGDWTCSCRAQASMHWPLALVIAMQQNQDDIDFSQDEPSVGAQLARLGMRPAVGWEDAQLVTVTEFGRPLTVLAITAGAPRPPEPVRFNSYADAKMRFYWRRDAQKREAA